MVATVKWTITLLLTEKVTTRMPHPILAMNMIRWIQVNIHIIRLHTNQFLHSHAITVQINH